MNPRRSQFWQILSGIWYAFVIIAPIVPIVSPQIITNFPLFSFLFAPAWLGLVGKLLYDNNSKFYFWTTRLFLWLTNTNVNWSLTVNLDAKVDDKVFQSLFEEVIKNYPESKPWGNRKSEKIVELPFGAVVSFDRTKKIELHEELSMGSDASLQIKTNELIVPFRNSDTILEELIALIGQVILPKISPRNEKYSFKIKFGPTNPYFGLFVRELRLPKNSLIAFRIEFDELVGREKERVDVSSERIALTAKSLNNLQALCKRYVTLATLDLSNR